MNIPKTSALLLVNSKVRNISYLSTMVHPYVKVLTYQHSCGLQGILELMSRELGIQKVEHIGFYLHSSPLACIIVGMNAHLKTQPVMLSMDMIEHCKEFRNFLHYVVAAFLNKEHPQAHLDFLCCSALTNCITSDSNVVGAMEVAFKLSALLGVAVGVSKDMWGTDVLLNKASFEACEGLRTTVGDLYFQLEKIKNLSSNSHHSLAAFERIRTVGKGAYGTAVLYRKKDDDSLVILKEINMHDLKANERQLALNEVKLLSMMDHPNIIGYFDSFEEDGILMIEMEYADGGTLSQMLLQQTEPFSEKRILNIFQQTVAGIHYIHKHKVLHRDLKTANIFLTKEGIVKIGDFGIAKMLSNSKQGANTVLGTPYYISPEMCEGKDYNEKSDVWALGCLLHELACLQKTFEGSNLPALVNKIMKGQFASISEYYSEDFRNLVKLMLNRNPEERPTSEEILYHYLPNLLQRFEEPNADDVDEAIFNNYNEFGKGSMADNRKNHHVDRRTVLYHMELTSLTLTPYGLPSKIRLRAISAASNHLVAISSERLVYTWGDNTSGQLGHGDLISRSRPEAVEILKGKSICKVCCGNGFTVFGSDNGLVMTCGDGSSGCLGHGDWYCTTRPRLIEALLSVDIVSLACGPKHVIAVANDGNVYAWGHGKDGRTGLNDDSDRCLPEELNIENPVHIKSAFAGHDGSILLTDAGAVLAMGRNNNNKLGLNHRVGFLMAMKNMFNKLDVEGVKCATPVRVLARHKVLDVSMGADHTAVLVEPGNVITFGRNVEGQLGCGNNKTQNGIVEVKSLSEKCVVNRVQCGFRYTVASTLNNELFLWGRRVKSSNNIPSSTMNTDEDDSTDSTERPKCFESAELHLQPVHILKLNNSSSGSMQHSPPDREIVNLSHFITFGEDLLIQVETTAPPPRRRSRRTALQRRITPENLADQIKASNSAQNHVLRCATLAIPPFKEVSAFLKTSAVTSGRGTEPEPGEEASSEASDADIGLNRLKLADSLGTIPQWLRQELDESPSLSSPTFEKKSSDTSVVSQEQVPVTIDLSDHGNSTAVVTFSAAGLLYNKGCTLSSSELETTSSSASTHLVEEVNAPLPNHQRPLNKIRQQNKYRLPPQIRRSKEKDVESKVNSSLNQAAQIKSQVEHLQEDKEKAAWRLFLLEQEKLEERRETAAREMQLKAEIASLRTELNRQSQMMQENHNMVMSLQQQLVRVQSQTYTGTQGQTTETNSKQIKSAGSRICALQ